MVGAEPSCLPLVAGRTAGQRGLLNHEGETITTTTAPACPDDDYDEGHDATVQQLPPSLPLAPGA